MATCFGAHHAASIVFMSDGPLMQCIQVDDFDDGLLPLDCFVSTDEDEVVDELDSDDEDDDDEEEDRDDHQVSYIWANMLDREASMLGASICMVCASVKLGSVVHESWVFLGQPTAYHLHITRSSSSLTCVTLYNATHDVLLSCSEANNQYWTQWSHCALITTVCLAQRQGSERGALYLIPTLSL